MPPRYSPDEVVFAASAFIATIGIVLALCLAVALGDEPHSHEDEVGRFYETWLRPKGNFSGIPHRTASCCNRADCFPVVEARRERGILFIRVDAPGGISPEYKVDEAIIESNQQDPRESPDARSHACIIGGLVVCLVLGGGA